MLVLLSYMLAKSRHFVENIIHYLQNKIKPFKILAVQYKTWKYLVEISLLYAGFYGANSG